MAIIIMVENGPACFAFESSQNLNNIIVFTSSLSCLQVQVNLCPWFSFS